MPVLDQAALKALLGGGSKLGFLGGPAGLLATSLAPMLFRRFFQRNDPAAQMRAKIERLLNPESIRQEGLDTFNTDMQSAPMQLARRQIVGAGGQLERSVMANAARSGLEMSGMGAVAPALAHSTIGNNLGQMTAAQYMQSMTAARTARQFKASLLGGMPLPQNYTGGFAGAGLNAMLQYLLSRGGGTGAKAYPSIGGGNYIGYGAQSRNGSNNPNWADNPYGD